MAKRTPLERAIDLILKTPYPPEALGVVSDTNYTTEHDDTDGETEQLSVGVAGQCSDVWLMVNTLGELRFRNMFGGGRYPQTRNALVVLAAAIKRDQEAINERQRLRGGECDGRVVSEGDAVSI